MDEATFNVCSRCGSANPLSAKYCYQCGFELKAPEAPVVCAKCHAVNPGSANFCKRCGSQLSSVQAKVICPQCSAANSPTSTHCVNCGYDFTAHPLPSSLQIKAAGDEKLSRKEKANVKKQEKARARAEKERSRQPQKAPVIQAQYVQPYGYYQQQAAVQTTTSSGKAAARIKSAIMFLIALAALYFMLLPQQISLGIKFPMAQAASETGFVALGGWDVIVAALTYITASAAKLSPVVSGTQLTLSLNLAVMAIAIAVAALIFVYYAIVKFICIISGHRRHEFDWPGLLFTAVFLAAAIVATCCPTSAFKITWQAYMIPLAFALITIFNFG